jgi:hypothetical protein
MSTILHYLPHFVFVSVALLALIVFFSDDDDRTKRSSPQRVKPQQYLLNVHSAHRD